MNAAEEGSGVGNLWVVEVTPVIPIRPDRVVSSAEGAGGALLCPATPWRSYGIIRADGYYMQFPEMLACGEGFEF
jgi:hypothetical protein